MALKDDADKRFIVIIWHQAGGRDDNKTYYTWSDEHDNPYCFDSYEKAKAEILDAGVNELHACTIIDMNPSKHIWV